MTVHENGTVGADDYTAVKTGVCPQSIPLDGLELVPAVQSLNVVQN